MSASYEVRGQAAVITLDNPPVNGLGYATRRDIADGIERAQSDPAVAAIVLAGSGRAFSGGADIREFGSPKAGAEPNLLTLIRLLEACPKPGSFGALDMSAAVSPTAAVPSRTSTLTLLGPMTRPKRSPASRNCANVVALAESSESCT